MTYLNEYHKATTEQKLSEMASWKGRAFDWKQQVAHIHAIAAEAERLYPRSSGRNENGRTAPTPSATSAPATY